MALSVFTGVVYAADTDTDVILYENDVHCAVEGYSKLAAMKNELSETYTNVGVVSVGNFCSDALRVMTGADMSFVNGGGLRAPMESGDITFNDIFSVFPFNNQIVTAEISGQRLPTITKIMNKRTKNLPLRKPVTIPILL